jgi:hypothetical protein
VSLVEASGEGVAASTCTNAATTAAERAPFVADAEVLIAHNDVPAVIGVLQTLGILLISRRACVAGGGPRTSSRLRRWHESRERPIMGLRQTGGGHAWSCALTRFEISTG